MILRDLIASHMDEAALFLWISWIYSLNLTDDTLGDSVQVLSFEEGDWPRPGPGQCDIFTLPRTEQPLCGVDHPNGTEITGHLVKRELGVYSLDVVVQMIWCLIIYVVCGLILASGMTLDQYLQKRIYRTTARLKAWANPVKRLTSLTPIEDKLKEQTLSEIMLGKTVPFLETTRVKYSRYDELIQIVKDTRSRSEENDWDHFNHGDKENILIRYDISLENR
ncbi:hypothetical protein ACHWQZ_G017079 [Mnemiopsis leidyi]